MPPGVNGFITASGGSGGIGISAGSSGNVTLRGLIIENTNSTAIGLFISSVGNLTLEDCTVRNFAIGLQLSPSSASKLYLYNSTFRSCGNTGVFALNPSSGTNVATINGCRFEQNGSGLSAGVIGSGNADVTVSDCVASGNTTAISAGTNATIRVSDSRITGNNAGIANSNGGTVLSRGNNTLENNTSGNTFPGTYSAK